MYEVGDVIKSMGKQRYVLTVKRCDKAAVEQIHDLMSDRIPIMFEVGDAGHLGSDILPVIKEIFQSIGDFHNVMRTLYKKIIKLRLLGY